MIEAEYKDLDKFQSFGKIPRYSRGVILTEKLDGTNAQILIAEEGKTFANGTKMMVGSRNRYITPEDDNYGFANWCKQNYEELLKLGAGRHYGEWWGCGIQRGYGLSERRFSLFNTGRWGNAETRPSCCHVVPVIDAGMFTDTIIEMALDTLKRQGSYAVPGFMEPEGIVIYHKASNTLFKKTTKDDEVPKSSLESAT
jgi:hypothetical protein